MIAQASTPGQLPLTRQCACGCGGRPRMNRSRYLPGHDTRVRRGGAFLNTPQHAEPENWEPGRVVINRDYIEARRFADGAVQARIPTKAYGGQVRWLVVNPMVASRFVSYGGA